MEGNYDRGDKEGEWKSYHESEELHIHCFYKNGWFDGLYQRFHENGAPASIGNLIENDQEGEWQYFDEDGNLTEKKPRKQLNHLFCRHRNHESSSYRPNLLQS